MDFPASADGVVFSTFVALYVQAIKGRLRSSAEIARRLKRFEASWGGREVLDIRRVDVARYISARIDSGLSNSSVNLEISTLSAAFGYAVGRWCWDLRNPVTGQHLPQNEGRLRYLSPDEVRALLTAAQGPKVSPHLLDFIRLSVNTGCRKNELLKLRWKDVELSARRMTIQGDNSKNGRRRIIPLNEGALLSLRSRREFCERKCMSTPWVFCYRDGRRVVRIDKPFWNALARAGIEDFRVHDLRHTFASWLVTEEVPLYHVKELLGHSSITMTERYAHLSSSALHKAVAVLDRL